MHTCLCVCVCMHTCLRVCVHAHVCVRVCMHTYLRVCVHAHIHACVRVCTHACMCMYMQVCLIAFDHGVSACSVTTIFWPSQTGAPGRCPWCPGHGSLPPGESMRSTQCSVLEVLLDPSTRPWRADNIITDCSCVQRGDWKINSPVYASTSKNSLKKGAYHLMITINDIMKCKFIKGNGWI